MPSTTEDTIERGPGEFAGEGVLLTGVVGAEEEIGAEVRLGAMGKSGTGTGLHVQRSQGAERAIPGKGAQANDDAQAAQQTYVLDQIGKAGIALVGAGPVAG